MQPQAGTGTRERERGAAFFVVTALAITATVIVGSYLSISLGKVRHVETRLSDSAAFDAAQAGLNALTEEVWTTFHSAPQSGRFDAVDHLDGKYDPAERVVLDDQKLGSSTFSAQVSRVLVKAGSYADVEIVSTGSDGEVNRTLTAVTRYYLAPSEVFDHAYFINNFGWLWGSGITVNGSVRSNGNFSLQDATVNGDIYASENADIGAAGTISGTSTALSSTGYSATASDQARPTNPTAPSEDKNGNGILDPGEDTNGNGTLDTYEDPDGYAGTSKRYQGTSPVEMPVLGDLTQYRTLAKQKHGTISQGGTVLVDSVLGDDPGEAQSLVLVGTAADPIVINGPVVINQDVVLKGVVAGQGTIYAGRNVHIVGNLTYQNPPVWKHPDTNPAGTKAANAGKDLLGLAAKGSIILGDYTTSSWQSDTASYQKPPFTQPYAVDPTDAANGYVTSYDSTGRPTFNGDYTAYDGGTKPTDDGTGTLNRRFYESSFSDAEIHSLAGGAQVTRVDAVLYTNHLLSGRIGDCTFNGTLVSRDEAIIYSSSLVMNYDVRVRNGGYEAMDIYLPRVPSYRVLYFKEGK